MSGGGKGGSQTTSVAIPKWLEDAARSNIARADEVASIGYTPYYGPDVAAMMPSQIAAMQGTNQAASAFGLGGADPMAGMPAAMDYGGMPAYSSGGLYDQSVARLAAERPAQYAEIMSRFIDPYAQPGTSSQTGGMGSKGGIPLSGGAGGGGGSYSGNSGGGSMWSDGMSGSQIQREQQSGTFGNSSSGSRGGGSSLNTPMSYAPGGVNTRNPSSPVNKAAAKVTSRPQGAPTSSDRPRSNPKY